MKIVGEKNEAKNVAKLKWPFLTHPFNKKKETELFGSKIEIFKLSLRL